MFKLTAKEALGLIQALSTTVGRGEAVSALVGVLGVDRAFKLILTRGGVRPSPDETVELVFAMFNLVPGATPRDKLLRVLSEAARVFGSTERLAEALAYIRTKWREYKDGGAVSTLRPALGHGTLTGYGPVNLWWKMSETTLAKILSRMAQKNVRYFPVEALGNGDEDVLGSPDKLEQVKARWDFVAAECRRLGIWFAPILFNDNVGKGNWKNGRIPLSQRRKPAEAFIDWVATRNPEGVAVTLVAETRTSTGEALQTYAARKLKASGYLIGNNQGSRPQSTTSFGGVKTDFFSYHPVNTGDWPRSAAAHVLSDTGAILAQLNLNSDPYAKGNPAALKAWRADGVARGYVVVAYYGFQTAEYDPAAIDAMSPGAAETGKPDSGDDVDLSGAVWHGPNGSGAKVTARMNNLKFDGTNFTYLQSGTSGWKFWNDGGKKLNSYACFFVFRDGKWRGGKFDACSPDRNWRDVKNIYGKDTGGIIPKNGEVVRVCLCGNNFTERTNAPATVWRSR